MEDLNEEKHIMQNLIQCREEALMSYGAHYKRIVFPFRDYIIRQMQEHDISSPVEMAVIMIQDAEHQEDADNLIRNIMSGCMELIEPTN